MFNLDEVLEFLNIVNDLNEHLTEVHGDDYEYSFNYTFDGYTHYISFDSHILWDSENEPREWIEDKGQLGDYEDLGDFIKTQYNRLATDLVRARFTDLSL